MTACIPFITYGNGNTNTREYCNSLIDSSTKEEKKNPVKAIEYLNEAQLIAETNSWKDVLLTILNNKGILYFDLLDYDLAMEYYLAAYQITLEQDNKKAAFTVLNNIGIVYGETNQHAKAIEYLEKAYPMAEQLNDTTRIIMLAINLIISFHALENPDEAVKYINALSALLQDKPNEKWSIYLNTEKAKNLYLRKKYDAAETLALATLQQYPKIGYDYNLQHNCKPGLLICLSKIYQAKGNREKAFYYGEEALKTGPVLPERINIYEYLSELYQQFNSPALALRYKDSLIITKDSLHKINIKGNLESSQIKIELLNSKNKLEENKARQKNERILYISLFIFISILAIILIWLFSIKSRHNKRYAELKLQQEKNQKLILEQQLKEQETISMLEQERFNMEMELKNRQLTTQVLLQANKKEMLQDVIQRLSSIPQQSKTPELNSALFVLRQQLKESEQWNDFLIHFQQINTSFISLLKGKHPDLNDSDIRLLSYIYLNLDNKKIAELLNISFDSLRKKKQRLANKIGIETTSLYTYLINTIK